MIVFIEGLSRSGKTLLIDKYIEKYPDSVRFKGAGQIVIGYGQRWDEYNYWMHNIVERMDELNNYSKVILWDRGLTESVYGNSQVERYAKCHIHKMAAFIDIPFKTLITRGTKEGVEIEHHYQKYEKTLSKFDTVHLFSEHEKQYITDQMIETLHEEIQCRLEII